ncbi:hypothetical protein [Flavobacterium daemonense]|uniref:hypothetical protein n=1 Tax=Flavobacterium daemonense TaxID=1393049 RepID=UPI0011855DB4|nr:hypothetical protein [Flavobacterium daemonense]KAF2337225.1 hypothetical protein FND99_02090 [Flavobacterium daemonense]
MKVLRLNTSEQFSCIPREYPNPSDTLSVKLKNELTNLVIDLVFTFNLSDAYLTVIVEDVPADFATGNKYEITITNITQQDKTVYLGKLLIVDEHTDIQNYDYQKQSNSRFEY